MKNKKLVMILSIALALVLAVGVTAYAASNYGTSSDPLITLSYLTDTLTPNLLSQLRTDLDAAVDEVQASSGSLQTYSVVTLSRGQTLSGSAGCEILLRSGSATCISGLADITDGTSLSGGSSLSANHLYMASADGSGCTASADSTLLLVRGSYTIA